MTVEKSAKKFQCQKISTYSISEEVIFEGPRRLEPHSLLRVIIRQKQTEFLSCKQTRLVH